MNPEPENYEPLRRLLSLKRQEAPPPGYFNRFADRVIARLHEPEPLAPLTWWQRFGLDFDFKPALVCGLGVVVCSLLSVGIITATQVGETEGFAGNIENPALLPLPGTAPATTASFASIPRPEEIPASTSPLMRGSSSASPFGQPLSLQATPTAFGFGPANN